MRQLALILMLLLTPGLAAQSFDGMTEAIERGDFGNLKAVILSRHGETIYENYFRGTGPGDLHQVHSVTKSVGSALVGIAHRQGRIRLNQDLAHFFSARYPMSTGSYQSKAAITVEQVLQQRHGIEWDEGSVDYRNPANPVGQMINSSDWYQYVLTRSMEASPGVTFRYSTGASTLMSRIIRVATGLGPDEFAMQELFGPLGIGPVHWEIYSEQGMGHGMMDWPNPDLDPPLGFSLWLSARDMLRFGELYLNGGVHQGRRILDRSWVEASWTKHSHAGNSDYFSTPGWGYGYQWWVATVSDQSGRDFHMFFASGWGSQVIFILPELGLVMATTADNYDHPGPDVDALLTGYVLPELNPRLDQRFNGAWYDPDADGQGITLEISEDGSAIVGFWYTYDDNGTQRWFTMQGLIGDDEAEVTIYETRGGAFLAGQPPYQLLPWGSGRFSTRSCDRLDFEFESDEISTSVPLSRLTGTCFEPPD
jgi:CubicO group peptidase (beta-lactamase class C family)